MKAKWKKYTAAWGFAALLATTQLYGFDDYTQFTGGQVAIGNDRAVDAMQNSAYLGFPSRGQKYSASFKQAGLYYLEINNPLFENQVPNNVLIANSFGAFSMHGLNKKFHMGLYVDNKLKRDFGDQPYYQIFRAQVPGSANIKGTSVSVDLKENFYDVALAFAYSLDEHYAFGINFFYGISSRSFSKTINVNFLTSANEVGLIVHREGIESNIANYGVQVGYVNRTDFGELAILVKPLDYLVSKNTRSLDFDFFVNGSNLSNTTRNETYNQELLEPIEVQTGLSQQFFSIIKIYLEVGVAFPQERQEKSIELTYPPTATSFPLIIDFDITTERDYSPRTAAGFAVDIPKIMTVYGGFNARKVESFVLYVNKYDSDDNIARSTVETTWAAQLGFSREIIKNLIAFAGMEYKSSQSDSEESEYTNGGLENTKYSKTYNLFTAYLGTDYLF